MNQSEAAETPDHKTAFIQTLQENNGGSPAVALCYLFSVLTSFVLYQLIFIDLNADSSPLKAFFFFALISYSVLYYLPAVLLHTLVQLLLPKRLPNSGIFSWVTAKIRSVVFILSLTIIQSALLFDVILFQRYGFHINGFVVNILLTPGGAKSLGASDSTLLAVLGGMLMLIVGSSLFLVFFSWIAGQGFFRSVWFKPKNYFFLALTLVLLQGSIYGYQQHIGNPDIYLIDKLLPAYQPITYHSLLSNLGFVAKNTIDIRSNHVAYSGLLYPQQPLQLNTTEKPKNIIWLVGESWRADSLTDEIMPNTQKFAANNLRFLNHYSGGNGTRMGMFTQFYGLYGSYWFDFLHEHRSPVLFDVLLEKNYQLSLYSSQNFTYPEFDKTIFSDVPKNLLHAESEGLSWQRDEQNVTKLLEFIEHRQPNRPFMTFMFFDSPQAKYDFPLDAIIRPDYLKDFYYLTTSDDYKKEINRIYDRYINSVHAMDKQFARIFNFLEQQNLLADTILVITADHGEEFMEKGHWGHNSAFTEEQIRVPLLIHMPGHEAQVVTKRTNHIDIIPTLMPLLGVINSAEDYSNGYSLLDSKHDDMMILADWSNNVLISDNVKQTLPMKIKGFLDPTTITDLNDHPLDHLIRDEHYQFTLNKALENAHLFYR